MTVTTRDHAVVTPTARRFFRRGAFWIAAALLLIVVAIVVAFITRPNADTTPLSPTGTGPVGSKALVQVLRSQGVTVTSTSTLRATRRSIDSAADTTLLVYDDGYLSNAQLKQLPSLASSVIIVTPTYDELRALVPSLHSAGSAPKSLRADCDLPAARKAGTISSGGSSYRFVGSHPDAVECFGSGHGAYSLVTIPSATGSLTVLGARNTLTNQHIIESGNAALALNLLGSKPNLVWYLPSIEDLGAGSSIPSFADEAPAWLIAITSLTALVIIAAGVWRGRRFGPLVIERPPVIVPASETMEGRARLYEKSTARLHALDALRVGTVQRLAARCGLPRRASVDEVIGAVAANTGQSPIDIRNLLIDTVPQSDAQLVALSDQLLILERAVETATTPH
jgi:hypothetical protein